MKHLLKLRRLWYTRHRKVVREPEFPYELVVKYHDLAVLNKLKLLSEERGFLKNEWQKLVPEKILGENNGT